MAQLYKIHNHTKGISSLDIPSHGHNHVNHVLRLLPQDVLLPYLSANTIEHVRETMLQITHRNAWWSSQIRT